MTDAPVFTSHDDGSVTVDGFTEDVSITPELLFEKRETTCGFGVERVGAEGSNEWGFRITCSNGSARYRVTGWDRWAFTASLVDCDGPRKPTTPLEQP